PWHSLPIPREPPAEHDHVALRHGQLAFVPHLRHGVCPFEYPPPTGLDARAVLDVAGRPEQFCGGVVTLVEQRVEGLECNGLIPVLGGGHEFAFLCVANGGWSKHHVRRLLLRVDAGRCRLSSPEAWTLHGPDDMTSSRRVMQHRTCRADRRGRLQ